MQTLVKIGRACQRYRKYVLHLTVKDIAERTGYSPSNIYAFESGRVNNSLILLWYMSKGLTLDLIDKG